LRLNLLVPNLPAERPVMNGTPNEPAVFIGRTIAACVHPYAAWRVLRPSARVVMVSTYATLTYLAVLIGLLISN
jgi:hypothetical protein